MATAQGTHSDILADVVAYLPVGLWVARAPGGEVVYANRAFQDILGMEPVSGVDIEGAPATYGIFDRQGRPYPVEKLPFSQALQAGRPVQVDDLVIHRARRRAGVRAGVCHAASRPAPSGSTWSSSCSPTSRPR